MRFPIFFCLIAPDLAIAEPLKAMKSAVSLATQLNAQLSVAIGALQVSVPNLWNSATIKELVAAEHERSMNSASFAQKKILALANTTTIKIHTEILKGDFNQLKARLAARARNHGLVFVEKGASYELLGGTLVEPLLFESGRPVMVVPHGFAAEFSFSRVLIAWDGSASAARAVWDSIAFLTLANTIEIVTVVGEKDLRDVSAATELSDMLSYLKKKINVTVLTYDGAAVSGMIQQHAAKTGADLIVQGAYGRSRWAEFILGGVTRQTLLNSTLPVLMSHQG